MKPQEIIDAFKAGTMETDEAARQLALIYSERLDHVLPEKTNREIPQVDLKHPENNPTLCDECWEEFLDQDTRLTQVNGKERVLCLWCLELTRKPLEKHGSRMTSQTAVMPSLVSSQA